MVMTMEKKSESPEKSLKELEERAMKLARLSGDALNEVFGIVMAQSFAGVYDATIFALRKRGMRLKRAKHFARAAKGLAMILRDYRKEDLRVREEIKKAAKAIQQPGARGSRGR